MELQYQIATAFAFDLLIGDPPGYPHPVRIMGAAARGLEKRTRKLIKNARHAGAVTAVTLISGTYGLCVASLWILEHIHPFAGTLGSIFLIYTCLSVRSLFDESLPVLRHLQENREDLAKSSLANIVGRDTQNLDQKEIVRATVETIAESTVDGILAPLLFAFLGGAPLAMVYKAINTMDSMFGHKDEEYLEFGSVPARLDDAANWVPARLAGPVIAFAAFLSGFNGKDAFFTFIRDGQKHLSPNSGIPEAAVAGALGIRLGGTNVYQGFKVEKPFLGLNKKEIEVGDISRSHRIMFIASLLSLAIFFIAAICFKSV